MIIKLMYLYIFTHVYDTYLYIPTDMLNEIIIIVEVHISFGYLRIY